MASGRALEDYYSIEASSLKVIKPKASTHLAGFERNPKCTALVLGNGQFLSASEQELMKNIYLSWTLREPPH